DGRARRWRFALGCVVAAVVMPPWGRAVAALGALMAVAASGGGLFVYTHVHYRLHTDGWTWVGAVILLLVLAGYLLGGGVLLRRRRGPRPSGGRLRRPPPACVAPTRPLPYRARCRSHRVLIRR